MDQQGESLLTWIQSWYSQAGEYIQFHRALWAPPPAAGEAALEQLVKSTHKWPHGTHLVLIPQLMTAHWRIILGKICGLIFTAPVSTTFWSNTHFEFLIIGLYLPLSRHKPWRLKGTPMLDRVEGVLRDLPVTSHEWGRGIVQKLSSWGDWTACQKVWCSPCYKPLDNGEFPAAKALDEGGMVTDCAEDLDCFRRGSNGDNLAMHFQCNLCPFQNLMMLLPLSKSNEAWPCSAFASRCMLAEAHSSGKSGHALVTITDNCSKCFEFMPEQSDNRKVYGVWRPSFPSHRIISYSRHIWNETSHRDFAEFIATWQICRYSSV